jgi:hypothetical protein
MLLLLMVMMINNLILMNMLMMIIMVVMMMMMMMMTEEVIMMTMNCYHGDWNDYFFINRMMHGASLSNQTKIVVFQSLKEISLSSVQ